MGLIAAAGDVSGVFIEFGAAVIGLAILARLANRFGVPTIPLYLLGGLAFGNGGLVPIQFSAVQIHFGAEVGVALLLFMLGLESAPEELAGTLRAGLPAGVLDMALNAVPGLAAGLLLGWGWVAALLLAGVTYVTSSGIVARLLDELGWRGNPETPAVLSVLVLEDLAMAVFLPLAAVALVGRGWVEGLVGALIATGAVAATLVLVTRYGQVLGARLASASDETIVLFTFGFVLLVAGLAQRLQVSAAIGAFLAGLAVSGPVVKRVHRLIGPLRDLFAALFFLFFGLEIDPSSLPPVLGPAAALAAVSAVTKVVTGWFAARRAGVDRIGRRRAALVLVPHGEFSVVIAGLALGHDLDPRLGPFVAAYVLILALLGTTPVRALGPWLADPSPSPAAEPAG
jgi:CPA2 family monovalent cation:H+ antiporter-2